MPRDPKRAKRNPRSLRNQASGWLFHVRVFGRGDRTTTPEYWDRWAANSAATKGAPRGKAVAFGRASHRSSSIVRFAALNPSAGRIDHAWAVGGDGVACSASSAFRVGWVEQSETQRADYRRGRDLGAAWRHAVVSASVNSATLSAASVAVVHPCLPQPPGTGTKASGAIMHLNSCSSGVNFKLALRPSAASVT